MLQFIKIPSGEMSARASCVRWVDIQMAINTVEMLFKLEIRETLNKNHFQILISQMEKRSEFNETGPPKQSGQVSRNLCY